MDLSKFIELGPTAVVALALLGGLLGVVHLTIRSLFRQMVVTTEKQNKQFLDAQERINNILDVQLRQVAASQERSADSLSIIVDRLLEAALRLPQKKE